LGLAAEVASPSFLAIDAERRLLFCVNEAEIDGQRGGGVTAYRIDGATATLTLINQRSSGGGGPCHLAIAPGGKHVVVANYGGGSVALLPIGDDGALGKASDFVQHAGSSVNRDRQEGPHAHCVTFDPSGKFVCVCDLGLDQVLVYKYDATTGKLAANDPPFVALKPGAGPRHLAFHPNGRWAYVVNELDSTVAALAYDAERGAFAPIGAASTLPTEFEGENSTAEIAVHPGGRYVYASNRGHDSIARFWVDPQTGSLVVAGHTSTQGQTPRHFGLSARGDLLVAANQNSGTLLACRVLDDGKRLEPAGAPVAAPTPVCVVFPGAVSKLFNLFMLFKALEMMEVGGFTTTGTKGDKGDKGDKSLSCPPSFFLEMFVSLQKIVARGAGEASDSG
jgi:6-phosphogluconolactonase